MSGISTRTHWPALLLAAFALPLGMTGCGDDSGGDGGSSTVDADFLDRADDVCTPYADYNAGHLLTVKGFSRFAPDEDQLHRIATFLDRNPAYHTLVPTLEDLGDPSDGADAWAVVIQDMSDGERFVQQEVRSARAGDSDAFASAEQDRADSNATLHADLLAAGFQADSACLFAQVDPLQTTTAMH